MRHARTCLLSLALLSITACSGSVPIPPPHYTPTPNYCVTTPTGAADSSPLCSVIPGNIGPDPMLNPGVAYNGIVGNLPTSEKSDVQTPFDNLSWQTFVALNWTKGQESQPAQQGLKDNGPRVWEGWKRVAEVFGNSPVRASCEVPPGLRVFEIGSDGNGRTVAQNEEYIQAATGEPAIDVNGNWTIYERRLNDLEIAYLKKPGGNASWDLTTWDGQKALIAAGGKVDFPSFEQTKSTGAIEIKAAWRLLDPAQHAANQAKFYVVPAMLTVPPDLVDHPLGKPAPICERVDLGLVAMHIIQKNVQIHNLRAQWFWSTFEHVENAPMAAQPCDPTSPFKCPLLGKVECPANPQQGTAYSYYNTACHDPDCKTNQPPPGSPGGPLFIWSPTQPFAKTYLTTTTSQGKSVTVGTQVSRCWQTYPLTDALNTMWRGQLRTIGSVFQNYMLVGTQWGGDISTGPVPGVPSDVVPNFLSNSVVETYLQNDPSGSCVTCHSSATLPVDKTTSSNLSFLPGLVQKGLVRRKPMVMKP